MKREEVLEHVCQTVALAFHSIGDYTEASDGFCRRCPNHANAYFRHSGKTLRYVRDAVVAKLKADGIAINAAFDPMTGDEILKQNAGHHEECERSDFDAVPDMGDKRQSAKRCADAREPERNHRMTNDQIAELRRLQHEATNPYLQDGEVTVTEAIARVENARSRLFKALPALCDRAALANRLVAELETSTSGLREALTALLEDHASHCVGEDDCQLQRQAHAALAGRSS